MVVVPRITCVAGLPGSGKSTWLAAQSRLTGAKVFDDFKADAFNFGEVAWRIAVLQAAAPLDTGFIDHSCHPSLGCASPLRSGRASLSERSERLPFPPWNACSRHNLRRLFRQQPEQLRCWFRRSRASSSNARTPADPGLILTLVGDEDHIHTT